MCILQDDVYAYCFFMSMCDVVYELVAVCLIFLVLIINGDGINKKKKTENAQIISLAYYFV